MPPREKTFLLARHEARVLEWLARRIPARVTPDHMTILGVLAALGIAAAHVHSNRDPAWLWAASALLVVHCLSPYVLLATGLAIVIAYGETYRSAR